MVIKTSFIKAVGMLPAAFFHFHKELSMNEELLKNLLDSSEGSIDSTFDRAHPATELSLDLWSLRQGESLLQESLKLQQLALSKEEVADLHGMAFLPNLEFHKQSQDSVRRQFMEQLTQSHEFQLLKDSTRLNLIASQIAATAFGKELHHLKSKLQGNTGTKDGGGGTIPTITSTAKAAKLASTEVGDFMQVCEIFGLGEGKPRDVLNTKEMGALFKGFQSNPLIRIISKLAGCYKHVAQGCHTILGKNGMDNFSKVVLGCELSRVLLSQFTLVALPELETYFLRLFAESKLMIRDFESNDPAGLGPVVIVVDESGSMLGPNVENAKAIALVFAWLARNQGRWCGLVSFSGDTRHSVLALPPDRSNTSELLDWTVGFIGGGSDQDLPVREMPAIFTEIGAPEGKTDLVYISDAQLNIRARDAEVFLKWKASVKAKLTSLVIGAEPGDLATISDKVHLFEALSPDSVKAKHVFSI